MAVKKEKQTETRAIDKLSPKDKEFLLNYFEFGHNATKAYMKTYPQAKYGTARNKASIKMTKANIQEAKREYLKDLWDKKEDKISEMFNKLVSISGADIGDFLDDYGDIKVDKFKELNTFLIDSYSKSVSDTKEGQNVRMTIKMADKLKAISELTKILGMITEKVEHSGEIEIIPAERPKRDKK